MNKIYHITHVDNLPSIMERGGLFSDAERIQRDLVQHNIGLTDLKQDRLHNRAVKCHQGTCVGDYVPFYFCPRSIMLYVLHKGNRSGLDYHGGQNPIVHLVADLECAVSWAGTNRVRWAFTDRNAGSAYAKFFADLDDLDQVKWDAVRARDFRDAEIKDGKQAEFLMFGQFPWELIEQIGVVDSEIQKQVQGILGGNDCNTPVGIEKDWYY